MGKEIVRRSGQYCRTRAYAGLKKRVTNGKKWRYAQFRFAETLTFLPAIRTGKELDLKTVVFFLTPKPHRFGVHGNGRVSNAGTQRTPEGERQRTFGA